MFGFKKEKKAAEAVDFTVTRDYKLFQVDEGRRLIRVKENLRSIDKQTPFSLDDIIDIELKCDDTTVNKRNMGAAVGGAVLLGPVGALLAGTHNKNFITYLGITIKLKNLDRPIVRLPLITSKMKKDGILAKNMVEVAENFVQVISILKEEDGN